MQDLISASAQGVVILYGPPGSGKTALFEELSHRVVKGEIPAFRGWKILRLKLKQVKGDSSIEGENQSRLRRWNHEPFSDALKIRTKKTHVQGNPASFSSMKFKTF